MAKLDTIIFLLGTPLLLLSGLLFLFKPDSARKSPEIQRMIGVFALGLKPQEDGSPPELTDKQIRIYAGISIGIGLVCLFFLLMGDTIAAWM